MSVYFNADEMYEIAEKIELNGAAFYRTAAKQSKDEEARKLLTDLATMEEEHRAIFQIIRSDLAGSETETTILDPDDDTRLYLQAISDGHVFNLSQDPSKILTGDESLGEILQMAIGFEKDSIIFYLGMKDMVPERLGKTKIETIIKEEQSHIILLSDQLQKMKSSS